MKKAGRIETVEESGQVELGLKKGEDNWLPHKAVVLDKLESDAGKGTASFNAVYAIHQHVSSGPDARRFAAMVVRCALCPRENESEKELK